MNKRMSFEAATDRLGKIVEQLESGEKPLDESLKLFEEGSALVSFCYEKLSSAEQKIKALTEQEETSNGKD